jgi:hypothetical protein
LSIAYRKLYPFSRGKKHPVYRNVKQRFTLNMSAAGSCELMKKSPEERVQRLEDIHEIQNLMGREQFFHMAALHDRVMELWAKKTPEVSVQISSMGKWEGTEGLKKVNDYHKYTWGDAVGEMSVHTLTTPIIEVAGDGKTARGVWLSPGARAEKKQKTNKYEAYWMWLKYGCDFVKEDGMWKIWHTHAYGIFRVPYDKSWVEVDKEQPDANSLQLPDELKPSVSGLADYPYSTTAAPRNFPEPPGLYETFDKANAY